MKTKHLIYLLGLPLMIYTCSSDSPDDVIPDPKPDPTSEITYDDNIKSIMSANCTQCHGAPTSQGAPFSLTTFTQVKNRVDVIISRMNNSANPMPPAGLLSTDVRAMVKQWKDDGLLEN
ncbi:hypothetical protein [uncultured Algibacter sp.]|uniref:hypothetical protein n=1 Tax=uncultured Algibacter sp. TaxID=298659 RepID=UPI002627EB19|nr:hypothetical protein [uncultured Algibacter sp.]